MFTKRALSPLIATILLIVVSVILITVVLTWGSGFAKENLSTTTEIQENTDFTGLLSSSYLGSSAILINNTNKNKDLNIIGYKFLISSNHPLLYLLEDKIYYLDEPLIISKKSSGVLSLDCIPEKKFILNLITSNQNYVSLNVVTDMVLSEYGCFEKSCNGYKTKFENLTDDFYLIEPLPNFGEFEVYCDMTTDGGGWTIVATNKNNNDPSHLSAESKDVFINNNYSVIPAISTKDNVTQEGYVALKYWPEIAQEKELRFVVGENTLKFGGWEFRSGPSSDWLHYWNYAECTGPYADSCWTASDNCGFSFDTPIGSRTRGSICYGWAYTSSNNIFAKLNSPKAGYWLGWYHNVSRYELVGNHPNTNSPEWMDVSDAVGDAHIALR